VTLTLLCVTQRFLSIWLSRFIASSLLANAHYQDAGRTQAIWNATDQRRNKELHSGYLLFAVPGPEGLSTAVFRSSPAIVRYSFFSSSIFSSGMLTSLTSNVLVYFSTLP
jgi:hypothetical protein